MFPKSIVLLSIFSLVAAEGLQIFRTKDLGYVACGEAIKSMAMIVPNPTDSSYLQFCDVQTQQALGSMAVCLTRSLRDNDYVSPFIASCAPLNLTHDQFFASLQNATEHLVEIDDDRYNAFTPIYNPILLDQGTVRGFLRAYKNQYFNANYNTFFGIALISYWFAIMFFAAIYHWTYLLLPGFVIACHGFASNFVRKHITLAPMFKKSHAQSKTLGVLEWMVPTRLESLIIAGYLVLAVVFAAAEIKPYVELGVARAVGDRAGVLTVFCIPVMILFAGRNNFLLYATGWTYSRFLIFHRWIARIMSLLVLVHIGAKTQGLVASGSYRTLIKMPFMFWGVVATVAVFIMLFHSLIVFRKRNYELFVLTHIILAVLFIAGGWIHCKVPGFQPFFIAATAIWACDRAVRIFRLMTFGVKEALVEVVADETLKVTIDRPRFWKPAPGAHAFIHFLRPTCFWQSHPFTLVDSVLKENTITVYIKIKGGVTHGLYRYIMNSNSKVARIKVTVEGPYSHSMPIRKMNTMVFMAGGNGIPGLYSEAVDLARRSNGSNKNIKFYWVIRHYHSIEWFYNELMCLKKFGNIETIIYVTNHDSPLGYDIGVDSSSSSSSVDSDKEKKETNDYTDDLKQRLSHVEFRCGRPNITAIVADEVNDAAKSIGFATCAHPAMVDLVRLAVVGEIGHTKTKRIELFEQIQGW